MKLSIPEFEQKYADLMAGLFLDNEDFAIEAKDLRSFATDIKDTFLHADFSQPLATTTTAGLVTLAELQDNLVLSSGKVITAQVLNGVLAAIRAGKENTGVAQQLVAGVKGNVPANRDTLEKLNAAINGLQTVERDVNYYQDLAGLANKVNGENVFVRNAHKDAPTAGAGDPTISTPNTWAVYKYSAASNTWLKIQEKESLDLDFSVYVKAETADAEGSYTPTVPADVTGLGLVLQAGKIKFRPLLDKILSLVNILKTGGDAGKFLTEAGTYAAPAAPDLSNYYDKTITYTQLEVAQLLAGKVDKDGTKQLSAEDFTTLLRDRLLQQSGTNTGDNAVNTRYQGKLDAVQAGENIQVDNTNPLSPKIAAVGLVKSVNGVSPDAAGNVSLPQTGGGVSDARVATYLAMIGGSWKDGQNIFVEDAAADPTVEAGSAYYKYKTADNSFTKLSESESMDLAFSGFTRDASAENTADYTPADANFFAGLLTAGKLKFKPALDRFAVRIGMLYPAGDGTQYWANDGTFKTVQGFTQQNVRDTTLTGLGSVTGALTAADSVVLGFSRLVNFMANIAATVRNTVATGLDPNLTGTPAATDSFLTILSKLTRLALNHTHTTAALDAATPTRLDAVTTTTQQRALDLNGRYHTDFVIAANQTFTFTITNPQSGRFATITLIKNTPDPMQVFVPANSFGENDMLLNSGAAPIPISGPSGSRHIIALRTTQPDTTVEFWWNVGRNYT